MATKKAGSGIAKYQSFIKTKTRKETLKVEKLTRELVKARKEKASATKKAAAAYKKLKK